MNSEMGILRIVMRMMVAMERVMSSERGGRYAGRRGLGRGGKVQGWGGEREVEKAKRKERRRGGATALRGAKGARGRARGGTPGSVSSPGVPRAAPRRRNEVV